LEEVVQEPRQVVLQTNSTAGRYIHQFSSAVKFAAPVLAAPPPCTPAWIQYALPKTLRPYADPDESSHSETNDWRSHVSILWELVYNGGRRWTVHLELETRRSSDTNFDTNLGTLLRTPANSLVRWRRKLSASAISDGPLWTSWDEPDVRRRRRIFAMLAISFS